MNLNLATKPARAIEYVLLHELAHLISPRHDARFIKVLDDTMPRWRSVRDEVNRDPLDARDDLQAVPRRPRHSVAGFEQRLQRLLPQLHSSFHKSPNTLRIGFDITCRRTVGDDDLDGAHDACANTRHDEDDLEFSHEATSFIR